MSAFVVSRNHIIYLSTFAKRTNVYPPKRPDGSSFDHDEAATLLWNENVRSVAYRYRESDFDNLPGTIGDTSPLPIETLWISNAWEWTPETAGRVLAALDCLEYQSCETPDYETTPAYEYLCAIRREAIRRVNGYDGTWEIK
jgi:hypothetical protein